MIAQGVQMGVKAAVGLKEAAGEHSRRRAAHKSAHAARRYVVLLDTETLEGGFNSTQSVGLRHLESSLTIPEISFSALHASACNIPPARLSELLKATAAAQVSLQQAFAAAKQAQAAAGFKTGVGKIALGGIRGALPLVTFVATGFRLDAQACRAALKKMQEAERLLESYWQQLQLVIDALRGAVEFTAPKQPLALSAILHVLEPGSTASLASCQHPIIQGLQWNLALKMEAKAAESVESAADNGNSPKRGQGRSQNGRGRGGGPFQMLRTGLKYARGSNKGMSEEQVADREPAIAMAAGACDADLLEFQRLIEQTEALQRWLQA